MQRDRPVLTQPEPQEELVVEEEAVWVENFRKLSLSFSSEQKSRS